MKEYMLKGGEIARTDGFGDAAMINETKTIIFEKQYGVSIDDFEDTIAVDKFIEAQIGRPLEVTDCRTSLTIRGGHIFGVSKKMTRESLERDVDESMIAIEAQRVRITAETSR